MPSASPNTKKKSIYLREKFESVSSIPVIDKKSSTKILIQGSTKNTCKKHGDEPNGFEFLVLINALP